MAIYDCCSFWQENDVYEIRINEHWDWVDKFIVVEAGETHAGAKKPYNFDEKRFEKYKEKLIYVKFDSFDEQMHNHPDLDCDIHSIIRDHQNTYKRDGFQFAYCVKALRDLGVSDTDLVYVSCADEILKKSAFQQALKYFENASELYNATALVDFQHMNGFIPKNTLVLENTRPIIWFEMQMFIYKMNLAYIENPGETKWGAGVLTEFSTLNRMLPSTIRALGGSTHPRIENGGWHLTYMDDTVTGEKLIRKMHSWAHVNDMLPNGKRRADLDNLNDAVTQIVQEFRLRIPESIIPVSYETHPSYLVENVDKFSNYILEV
jgi:beta-1,4-mannosyl-glycoprotein beta-1,4-N-acetylglucosaminyltransferase